MEAALLERLSFLPHWSLLHPSQSNVQPVTQGDKRLSLATKLNHLFNSCFKAFYGIRQKLDSCWDHVLPKLFPLPCPGSLISSSIKLLHLNPRLRLCGFGTQGGTKVRYPFVSVEKWHSYRHKRTTEATFHRKMSYLGCLIVSWLVQFGSNSFWCPRYVVSALGLTGSLLVL